MRTSAWPLTPPPPAPRPQWANPPSVRMSFMPMKIVFSGDIPYVVTLIGFCLLSPPVNRCQCGRTLKVGFQAFSILSLTALPEHVMSKGLL